MSIGKSSIARAANSKIVANNTNTVLTSNIITNFAIDNIGVLTIAKTPNNIESIKQSIKKRGVLSPVLIAVTPKGDSWLIDGYRRLFAARELNILQINATVINVENKSEANRLYTEFLKTKCTETTDTVREEKFRVLCVKDHDLPTYLL